jgi:hypothetical protein
VTLRPFGVVFVPGPPIARFDRFVELSIYQLRRITRIPGSDGLWAVAVVLVVATHAGLERVMLFFFFSRVAVQRLWTASDIEDFRLAGLDYNEAKFEFHIAILYDQGFVGQDDGDPGFELTKGGDGFLVWSVLPLR